MIERSSLRCLLRADRPLFLLQMLQKHRPRLGARPDAQGERYGSGSAFAHITLFKLGCFSSVSLNNLYSCHDLKPAQPYTAWE